MMVRLSLRRMRMIEIYHSPGRDIVRIICYVIGIAVIIYGWRKVKKDD